MAELELKLKIDETAILRLTDRKKDRYEFKTHNREEWLHDYEHFGHLYYTWREQNPNGGPRILEIPSTLKL